MNCEECGKYMTASNVMVKERKPEKMVCNRCALRLQGQGWKRMSVLTRRQRLWG